MKFALRIQDDFGSKVNFSIVAEIFLPALFSTEAFLGARSIAYHCFPDSGINHIPLSYFPILRHTLIYELGSEQKEHLQHTPEGT